MSDTKPVKKVPFEKNKVFAGVCAGVSYATGIEVWIIRAICLIAFFALTPGPVIIGYIVAALVLPEWDELPADYSDRTGD